MKTMKRNILTLVALFAMTTGAWADDYLYLEVDGTSATVKYGDKGTKPYYGDDPRDPGTYGWYVATDEHMPDQVTNYNGKNSLTTVTIDASCQNYTGTTLESFFDFWSGLTTINNLENLNTSEVTNMKRMFTACSSMTSFDLSGLNTAKVTKMRQMFTSVSVETLDLSGWNTSSVTDMYCMFYNCPNLKNIYVGDGWSTASVTDGTLMFGKCTNLPGFDSDKVTDEMAKLTTDGGYLQVKPESPDLTFNDDKTEASFDMPAYDVTVDYELVRDMASNMPVTVGDGTDGYRIRLKKEGTSFVPAEMTPQQMAGLIVVKDDIEDKTLTNVTDYTVQIFAVDDQDEPTGNAIAFQSLTPGRYVAIASAADGSIYDGKTQQSNVFVLFQGYEIVVPAGEYVTYYRDDDNLYVEGEGAKLYTITDVDGSTATATEITSANKEMPFLIYNGNTRVTTFLLIPTDTETNQAFYAGFKGTTEATTIAASDATSNNYALNGRQFVWVKNALAIGANKAWLEIPAAANNARALTLVFDDATKITTTNYTNLTDGDWYDLNGRKLQSVPTKKGVYIMNGRKVVIK